MKSLRRSMFLLILAVSTLTTTAQETVVTIGLIGDSTAADTYGWGPSFAALFNNKAKVLNQAKNGATLKSLSSKLDDLLAYKPDYVLIQFGHNDQKQYDTEVYGTLLTSYVKRVKKSGGVPVVLSSVTRRLFDGNGKIKPRDDKKELKASLPFYAKVAQAVAIREGVPFIDLYSISVAHHNRIGPGESRTYNYNGTDTTHFSKKGADAIADLVIAALRTERPEITSLLK